MFLQSFVGATFPRIGGERGSHLGPVGQHLLLLGPAHKRRLPERKPLMESKLRLIHVASVSGVARAIQRYAAHLHW